MVIEKYQQIHRVGIHDILCQVIIDTCQSPIPAVRLFIECRRHDIHQWEIHDRRQVRVPGISHFAVFLPERDTYIISDPRLPYYIKIGIFSIDSPAPTCHHIEIGIRMRILSDTVDPSIFNPPDTVLDQVRSHVPVTLVQVGHRLGKPAVYIFYFVVIRTVSVGLRHRLVTGLHEIILEVEPVVGRFIFKEEMFASAVVKDHIHYDLQSLIMSRANQLAKLFIITEARIDFIIISNGIPVIGAFGHIVLQDRIQPNSGNAQVGEIIQMIGYPFQVTSVAGIHIRTIHFRLAHSRNDIILRITVGETIGHDQV